jgi:hypothetical protein
MEHADLVETYYKITEDWDHFTVYQCSLQPAMFGYIREVKLEFMRIDKMKVILDGTQATFKDAVRGAAELLFGKLNWKE